MICEECGEMMQLEENVWVCETCGYTEMAKGGMN